MGEAVSRAEDADEGRRSARAGDVEGGPGSPGSSGEERPPVMRDLLRALPVFAGHELAFNVTGAPADPYILFRSWLKEAIGAGAPEPHVMTLSTVDADGRPDARMLILKDLSDAGFWFATSADSSKGRQLGANPAAALTFYWPLLGRQVRVRGHVEDASTEQSARDFLARGLGARAVALASTESSPLASRAECAAAVEVARARLDELPDLVATTWTLCVVRAEEIEFWQADRERQHCRLRYTARRRNRWDRCLLWP